MAQRATHAFVGVIEQQEVLKWSHPYVPGDRTGYWKLLRRRIRVENVLRGRESRDRVDIYEIFWTGGATGDWNATETGKRYVFLVRTDGGVYHVVGDWWRSVFPVSSGHHSRAPLTDATPLWERIALMMWWEQPDWDAGFGEVFRNDPGGRFTVWRTIKLLRGLLRHPDPKLQDLGCESLLMLERAQDECWDMIPADQRKDLNRYHNMLHPLDEWRANRTFEQRAQLEWDRMVGNDRYRLGNLDDLRVFTTINNTSLRTHFCDLFSARFPGDSDNGCPANQPPPATILTEDGDIPLVGPWPAARAGASGLGEYGLLRSGSGVSGN